MSLRPRLNPVAACHDQLESVCLPGACGNPLDDLARREPATVLGVLEYWLHRDLDEYLDESECRVDC